MKKNKLPEVCPKCGCLKSEHQNNPKVISFTCGTVYVIKTKQVVLGYHCLELQMQQLTELGKKLWPDMAQWADFVNNVEDAHARNCDCDLGTECPKYKQVKQEMEQLQRNVMIFGEMLKNFSNGKIFEIPQMLS